MDESDQQRTIAFLREKWPPADAWALYNMGRNEFCELGKIPSLRATLAICECRTHDRDMTEYERSCIRAVQDWVVNPTKTKRILLGRLAGMQSPGYSFARNLANMASRSVAWKSAIAFNLTGNPDLLSDHDFHAYCDAIHEELMSWASGAHDPIAARLANDDMSE